MMLESITEGYMALDRDWRYTYVSAVIERLTGRSREELLGRVIWELFPQEVGTEGERRCRRVVSENVPESFENYWAQMDRWLIVSLYPSGDGGLIAFIRDNTEHKRLTEELRTKEERFRRIFELGLIGMAITSAEKGITDVNDEICRILGYERSELLTKTWAELTHTDDLPADVANFNRVLAGEFDGYTLDKRWICKDGRVIYSTISVKCVRRPDGAPDYFVALLQDITARKQTEESLARSRVELELRVRERTKQLTVLNEELRSLNGELRNEIVERKRAEKESLELRNELASELTAMTRLHELSSRFLSSASSQTVLEEILDAIIELQHADFGNIQIYNPEPGVLEIIAQRGFQQDFLDYFKTVHDPAAACGRAIHARERVIVEDVRIDPEFEPHREIAAAAGFCAVHSTPLVSRTGDLLGVLSTHFREPHRPSARELRVTDVYAMHAAELLELKSNEAALVRYQKELQGLTARLIEAQEAEGKLLSRELHDVVSQELAVLGIDMAALAQAPQQSPEAVRGRLLALTAQVGALAEDIHRISRQLHPAILDDLGLASALQNECVSFSDQYGIPAEFTYDSIPRNFPEEIALCLYRVAQESLRNVGKHAKASEVAVKLTGAPGEIVMDIEDFGDGFDLETIEGKGGLGLVSMEERVRLLKGTFRIRSGPGKGTSIQVRIPLHQHDSHTGGS